MSDSKWLIIMLAVTAITAMVIIGGLTMLVGRMPDIINAAIGLVSGLWGGFVASQITKTSD